MRKMLLLVLLAACTSEVEVSESMYDAPEVVDVMSVVGSEITSLSPDPFINAPERAEPDHDNPNPHVRRGDITAEIDGAWLVINGDRIERLDNPLYVDVHADSRVWVRVNALDSNGDGVYHVYEPSGSFLRTIASRNVIDSHGDYILTVEGGEQKIRHETALR